MGNVREKNFCLTTFVLQGESVLENSNSITFGYIKFGTKLMTCFYLWIFIIGIIWPLNLKRCAAQPKSFKENSINTQKQEPFCRLFFPICTRMWDITYLIHYIIFLFSWKTAKRKKYKLFKISHMITGGSTRNMFIILVVLRRMGE